MSERAIFIAALNIAEPDKRAAYLEKACAGDPSLRQRIAALLRNHEEADSFLQQPALEQAPSLAAEAGPGGPAGGDGPGSRIGPYKLLEQIGEGGFGVVFMAEQTRPVRRKVALKDRKSTRLNSSHVAISYAVFCLKKKKKKTKSK